MECCLVSSVEYLILQRPVEYILHKTNPTARHVILRYHRVILLLFCSWLLEEKQTDVMCWVILDGRNWCRINCILKDFAVARIFLFLLSGYMSCEFYQCCGNFCCIILLLF